MCLVGVGILMFFVWPVIQSGIYALAIRVLKSGYVKPSIRISGAFTVFFVWSASRYFIIRRSWQTGVGAEHWKSVETLAEGAQYFAQPSDPDSKTLCSISYQIYASGNLLLMIFGLPGAALAMYRTAKPEKEKRSVVCCFPQH